MTQEEIHDGLDAMLANPKSKNFLNHLVRAYFPIAQVEKVWPKSNGELKCVLTKDRLVTVEDLLEAVESEEFKHNMIESLKKIFDDKVDQTNPIIKTIGEKKLAVTGKNTTTYMSYPAFQEFFNWITSKSLKGDKHINWLLGSIRRNTFIERAETIEDKEAQKKIEALKKEVNKAATFTLGEMDAFKKLRENFKK